MCRKGLNMWWYLIIGLCIGFIVGNISGVVLMAIMAASSMDSRRREYCELREEIDKVYMLLNDHMLTVAPDERTAPSEYEFRKGLAIGIQQSLNCIGDIGKGEIYDLQRCKSNNQEC